MYLTLVRKEFRCLWRARHIVVGTFSFALLLIVVSCFSFLRVGYGQRELQDLTPGILWLIFLFSGMVCLTHSFIVEQENDALNGVLLSSADPSCIFFAKWTSNLVFVVCAQVLVLFAHVLFFGVELGAAIPQLLLLQVLAAIGFVSLGTLLSAMAVCTRGRDIVLPLTLFPLLIPLLAAVVFLSQEVIETGQLPYNSFWFLLVCVFDVISLTLALVLFEFVVHE